MITGKRIKYVGQSVVAFIFMYLFLLPLSAPLSFKILLMLGFVAVASVITHFPNVKFNNIVFGVILPFQLFLGTLLFLTFYPNLSSAFKIVVVVGFSVIYYLVSLMDNIFFVVQDREEQIPLYRVAVTGIQILTVIVAIPLFSALFKFNLNVLVQSFLVFIFSVLFGIYQFWGLHFDKDLKVVRVGELAVLNLFVGFLATAANMSVSFFPTEPFIRALYVSSVLSFGLGYVHGHLKNDINKKGLLMFIAIILIFFFVLLTFKQ
jgi:hypothetical protein